MKTSNLIASPDGENMIRDAIRERGIVFTSEEWIREAEIVVDTLGENMSKSDAGSIGTWRAFYSRKHPIRPKTFKLYCAVLNLDWNKVCDLKKNHPETAQNWLFNFGHLNTTWLIKDGTGEYVYRRENVISFYKNNPIFLTDDLIKAKAEIKQEQQIGGHEGKTRFWNSKRYYLNSFIITRTSRQEDPRLEFWFGPSDYFTYLATNQRLDQKKLRKKYLRTDWTQPVPFFPMHSRRTFVS